MTNEVRLKECEKKLDIKDNSENKEMARNNNETDLENTYQETPETLTASEPKGMSAIAQVLHLSFSVGGGGGQSVPFPKPMKPGFKTDCLSPQASCLNVYLVFKINL